MLNLCRASVLSAAKPLHHRGEECLRLRVDVTGHKGSAAKAKADKAKAEEMAKAKLGNGKGKFAEAGGVHNPTNRLPAGEHCDRTLHYNNNNKDQ